MDIIELLVAVFLGGVAKDAVVTAVVTFLNRRAVAKAKAQAQVQYDQLRAAFAAQAEAEEAETE